jgi:thiol-disulfide isomerase/thioredoxin
LKNSEKGKAVSGAIENANHIKVNILAPGFTEKDTSGVAISLSSYKGQYVLVDFWASWCHPCRAENPYLKSAFEEYKEKNFTILSVSLDNSRKAWISAIQKDSLPWSQVSALDPQKSESVYKYGIKTIPRNFLVDPNGRIVAMDLRGKDLATKLAEILKKPS